MKLTIQNFLNKIKKYAYSYKNGFYITPFLNNSPQLIFESITSMPFMKKNKEGDGFITDSLFAKGFAYYLEVEEGFWVYFSDMNYKVNLEAKLYYDTQYPANYYVLSFNIVNRNANKNIALLNGNIFNNYSWNILKPESAQSVINFKGTQNISLGLYLSENWFKQNLPDFKKYKASNFESFILSAVKANIWQANLHEVGLFYDTLKKIVSLPDLIDRKKQLKQWGINFLKHLIEVYPVNHLGKSTAGFDLDLHRDMMVIENRLMDHLFNEFPGIESLAKTIKTSPTKLKTDFKAFFGMPVYKYYSTKKLEYAYQLLQRGSTPIHEISRLLNYENEANFTRAFKNKFSVLPSEIKQKID